MLKAPATLTVSLLLLTMFIFNCEGEQYRNVQDPNTNYLPDSVPIDTATAAELNEIRNLHRQRVATGDTTSVSPDKLSRMITDTIPGYRKEIDKADRFETATFTFSEATKVFYEVDGTDYIEFIVGDYVANPNFFEVFRQRYELANGYELGGLLDEKISAKPIESFSSFLAYHSLNSTRDLVQVHMAADYRYHVLISATGREEKLSDKDWQSWVSWTPISP